MHRESDRGKGFCILLLLGFTLVALAEQPAVNVLSKESSARGIHVILSIPPPQPKSILAPDGQFYTKLVLPGVGADNKVGYPALPVIHYSCEIPAGMKASVAAEEQGLVEQQLASPLWPQQKPAPKRPGAPAPPEFVVNNEAYHLAKSSQYQKAYDGQLTVKQYRKRGQDYVDIIARPFAYHAQKGALRFPAKLALNIDYTAPAPPKAAGPRVGKISILQAQLRGPADLQTLQQQGYNFELIATNRARIYATDAEVDALKSSGFVFDVVGQQPPAAPGQGAKASGYHNYASITALLQQYSASYPSLCRLSSIGHSTLGRDLWAMKITRSPDSDLGKARVRLAAAMHGDEPLGAEMMLDLIDALLKGSPTNSRLSRILDSTELWVLPVINPDGLEAGTRFNASGFDLNRSFPEGAGGGLGNPVFGPAVTTVGYPPEVIALMKFATNHNCVLAANFHGGSLVVNYPYDNDNRGEVDSPSPDDSLFQAVSRAYSSNNPAMWASSSFPQGIVNGAAWYVVQGGLQDWSYRYAGCNEVTIEMDEDKLPDASQLPAYWSQNEESLLSYIETAQTSVQGLVTNAANGQPIYATVKLTGIEHLTFSDANTGRYRRMTLPGACNLAVAAPGFVTCVLSNVVVSPGQSVRLDVGLQPIKRDSERILLVTSQSLSSSLPALQARKEADGFQVQTVVVADGSTTNQVRTAIRNAWASFPAEYIILVGDVEEIPAFDDGHATDLPYALMDPGEWFSDFLGKDAVLGRISLKTTSQLDQYAQKLNAFAAAPASSTYDITWVSGGSNDSENTQAERGHDYCITNCVPTAYKATRYYRSNGSLSQLNAHINSGTAGVIYSGHGNETGWYRFNYGIDSMASLANTSHIPIVIGHCCLSGSFQDDVCLGEGWSQTTARAAVYVGSTDYTYWDEDEWMQDGEFDAMAATPGLSIGKAIDGGRYAVYQRGSTLAQYYYSAYHVLGDPTLALYQAAPQALAIRTAPTLPPAGVGSSVSISLQATGGSPPYSWSLVSGALPDGLALSSSGQISGASAQAGSSQFTVQATDSSSSPQTATATFTLTLEDLTQDFNLALNVNGWSWTPGGNAPWQCQSSVTHDGANAAQSGAIGDSSESWLEAVAYGPGRLSFWWKVSSEQDFDFLEFYIDDVRQGDRISGEVDWIQEGVAIASGTHRLRWRYVKNESGSAGSDCGWIDQVSLTTADKPTVAIVTPSANVAATNSIIATGTVKDRLPITQVQVKVNDAEYAEAALSTNSAGLLSWSIPVPQKNGSNTIQVKALNWAGNQSAVVSRHFDFISISPFTLNISGPGSVVPNLNGDNLVVGRSYTLSPRPGARCLFSNWVSSLDGSSAVVKGGKLTFIMQTNLSLTANFATNKFIGLAGTYSGLFTDATNGVSKQSAGFITLTADGAQRFSGRLFLDGQTNGFSGALDIGGAGSKVLNRRGKSPVTVAIQLDLEDGTDQVSGSVSCPSDGWTSQLLAHRGVWNSDKTLAATYSGGYTLVLPATSDTVPAGNGFSALRVSKTGSVAASGSLGDGTMLRPVSTMLSKNGDWPFYATAGGAGRGNAQMVLGWLNISNLPPQHIGGSLSWINNGGTGFYSNGFTNEVAVFGSPYRADSSRVIALTNGVAVLSGGNLSDSLTNSFTLVKGNRFVGISTNSSFKLSVVPATGVFTGSFKNPDRNNASTAFSGVVVQDAVAGFGVFKGTNQSGAVLLMGD